MEANPQLKSYGAEQSYLRRAVELAIDNAESGQLPFGAIVVLDNQVVATGVNTALKDDDPTAHAELAAVRAACRTLRTLDLNGATIYSSCEPCAFCHAVATAAGAGELVYATTKEMVPDLGVVSPNQKLMESMQRELRSLAPTQLRHLPLDGAEEPFHRFPAGA
jgi:tRNA(Arg) A34 adenosine deaminase TadA